MSLPVSFRVVALNADESMHRTVLQEQREPQPPRLGPCGPAESPLTVISTEVSPETFQSMRIGQVFVLVPMKDDAARPAAPAPGFTNGPCTGGVHAR